MPDLILWSLALAQSAQPLVPEIFAHYQNRDAEFVVNTPKASNWKPEDADLGPFASVMNEFLKAEWTGNWERAYALTTPDFKEEISYTMYRSGKRLRGDQSYFRVLRFTWYPEAPLAHKSGLYMEVDFVGAFETTPFYCGYVIARRDLDGTIGIVRFEENAISQQGKEPMSSTQLREMIDTLPCYKG